MFRVRYDKKDSEGGERVTFSWDAGDEHTHKTLQFSMTEWKAFLNLRKNAMEGQPKQPFSVDRYDVNIARDGSVSFVGRAGRDIGSLSLSPQVTDAATSIIEKQKKGLASI